MRDDQTMRDDQGQTFGRRQALLGGGVGASLLLKGLATGLPPAWLCAIASRLSPPRPFPFPSHGLVDIGGARLEVSRRAAALASAAP